MEKKKVEIISKDKEEIEEDDEEKEPIINLSEFMYTINKSSEFPTQQQKMKISYSNLGESLERLKLKESFGEQQEEKFKEFVDFKPVYNSNVVQWTEIAKGKKEKRLPRSSHSSTNIKDKEGNAKIFLSGGSDAIGIVSQYQVYDCTDQQIYNIPIKGKEPVNRFGHTATLDHHGEKILVIGGYNTKYGYLNSVHVLSNVDQTVDKWHWGEFHEPTKYFDKDTIKKTLECCGCSEFSPTYYYDIKHLDRSLVYDYTYRKEVHNVPILLVSENNMRICDQIFRNLYNYPNGYGKIPYDTFPNIAFHTANRIGQNIYIFGGDYTANKRSNDIYMINYNNWRKWERRTLEGRYEEGRYYVTKRTVMYWSKLHPKGDIPSPRSHHASCVINHQLLYIIGGRDGKIKFSDIYHFDYVQELWTKVEVRGATLPPMYGHSVCAVGTKIFIFGGISVSQQILNNIYIFDAETNQMSQINVGGTHPSPRAGSSLTLIDDQMILIGGYDKEEHKDDIFVLQNFSKIETFESSIGKDLLKMLDDKLESDISFLVEGKEIFSHKIILSSRCQIFRKLFSENNHPNPIIVANYSYQAFLKFLEYIYSDTISLSSSIVSDVYKLAKAYDLKQLINICESMFRVTVIPPSSYSNDLSWAINNQSFSDVRFLVEGKLVYAHKSIVSLRSTYFKSMLHSNFKESSQSEVKISEISKETFDLLIEFIYSDKINTDPQQAFDLLAQSELYGINEMKERTEQILLEYVDEDNVCVLFQQADTLHANRLKQSCKIYILKNYFEIATTDEYKSLPKHLIEQINTTRKQLGMGYAITIKEIEVKKEDKTVCNICNLPLFYDKKTWENSNHPKILLQSALSKKNKNITSKFVPFSFTGAQGHFSKIIIVDSGKQKEISNNNSFDSATNKKDAEAKVSIIAYHQLFCEKPKEETKEKKKSKNKK